MFILGVTGNSGSGKSAVCEILKKYGAYIIDADKLARKVLEKDGSAYEETVHAFGRDILFSNGEIDRKTLSEIVFNNEEKLKELNRITHKHVINDMRRKIHEAKDNKSFSFICLDVPLLFESGTEQLCDLVWLVDAPYEVKLQRIIERDNLSCESAALRLNKQTKPSTLSGLADEVITNTGSLCELEKIVVQTLSKIDSLDSH